MRNEGLQRGMRWFCVWLIWGGILSPIVLKAEKLDAFEKSVTAPQKQSEPRDSDGTGYQLGDWFFKPLFEALFELPVIIAREGILGAEDHALVRDNGDPLVPKVRLDLAYQYLESDLAAAAYTIELGYAWGGAEFRQTRYMEQNPDDKLDFLQLHALFRPMVSEKLQCDVALGPVWLIGDETTLGWSFGLPFRYWFHENAGVEFRPMWSSFDGTSVSDYDLSLSFRYDYIALRLGYRWVSSPQETLDGAYIGITFRY